MIWPVDKPAANIHYIAAQIKRVSSDEAGGELCVRVAFESGAEVEIVYEGMYYSQLDESAEGRTLTLITKITPEELKQQAYRAAAAKLYDDCGADENFLRDMYRRGSQLFVHHMQDGHERIVLAKRLAIGETRGQNADSASEGNQDQT